MNGIDLMVDEHKNILRMLNVVRKVSYNILQGDNINYEDFAKIIDFVRNYADAHHHGKEEKFLFNRMVSEIGEVAEKIINFGMLIEHDLGRFYMKELEEALSRVKSGDEESKLDIIANAISYTQLLHNHIDKEDKTVYTFANRHLSKETLSEVDLQCEEFEKNSSDKNIQDKYLKILEELEEKYIK